MVLHEHLMLPHMRRRGSSSSSPLDDRGEMRPISKPSLRATDMQVWNKRGGLSSLVP